MPARADLAKIHLGKKALGLTEDDYRALLMRIAGVSSAANLTTAGMTRVLAEYRRLGWSAVPARVRQSGKPGVRLIFGLWTELGRLGVVTAGRPALFAFVKRQTGVENPEWLAPGDVNKVIEGLKAMRARVSA